MILCLCSKLHARSCLTPTQPSFCSRNRERQVCSRWILTTYKPGLSSYLPLKLHSIVENIWLQISVDDNVLSSEPGLQALLRFGLNLHFSHAPCPPTTFLYNLMMRYSRGADSCLPHLCSILAERVPNKWLLGKEMNPSWVHSGFGRESGSKLGMMSTDWKNLGTALLNQTPPLVVVCGIESCALSVGDAFALAKEKRGSGLCQLVSCPDKFRRPCRY